MAGLAIRPITITSVSMIAIRSLFGCKSGNTEFVLSSRNIHAGICFEKVIGLEGEVQVFDGHSNDKTGQVKVKKEEGYIHRPILRAGNVCSAYIFVKRGFVAEKILNQPTVM